MPWVETLPPEAPRHSAEGTLFDPGEPVDPAPLPPGQTTLDRLHQAMLLFGDGRSDALRRKRAVHIAHGRKTGR